MSVATQLPKVNVGAGNRRHREGYLNLDANAALNPDIIATVPPLPFDDDSVAAIYASHFLEHLDREDAIEFMRECHRVLIPGGDVEIIVPYAFSEDAWRDPTHRSFYVRGWFLYFTPVYAYLGYGLPQFEAVAVDMGGEAEVHAHLRKPGAGS